MSDEAKSSLALRASASGGTPMSRLEVPESLQQTDNTPTPTTQLLREVEAVGLFSDSAEAVVAALNPFDEHFRKAAAEVIGARPQISDAPGIRAAKSAEEEGSLHTPNILISDSYSVSVDNGLAASSSATLSAGITVLRRNASKGPSKSYRPIKPSSELEKQVSQTAKLMLRLPTGEAIHLSDMPLIKMEGDGDSASTRDLSRKERFPSPPVLSVGQMRTLQVGAAGAAKRGVATAAEERRKSRNRKLLADVSTRQNNLERNRAAAQRSRDRKKRRSSEMEQRLAQIGRNCGNLAAENHFLRQELSRLKALLKMHLDCDVTKESGLRSLILSETQTKIIACASPVPRTNVAAQSDLNVPSRDILDEATRVIRESSLESGSESCQNAGYQSEAAKQRSVARTSRPPPKKQKRKEL